MHVTHTHNHTHAPIIKSLKYDDEAALGYKTCAEVRALYITHTHTHTLWKTRPPRPAARSQSSPPVSLYPSLSPFSCRYNNEPTEASHCGTPAVWVRDSKGGKRKMCAHQPLLQDEKRRVCEAAEKKRLQESVCRVMTRTSGRRARSRAHSLRPLQRPSEEQARLSKHDGAELPTALRRTRERGK